MIDFKPKIFLAEDLAVEPAHGFIKDLKSRFRFEKDVLQADGILTFGGDGTMLRTIHMYEKFQCPFIGIGFGTVNFLMNDNNEDNIAKLDSMLQGQLRVDTIEVATINSYFYDKKGTLVNKSMAVNDIVIGSDLMSWIKFDVRDEERIFGQFSGSGICVSTSTGSTGWNKNNGGHVLPLNSELWSFTGLGTTRRINEVIDAQQLAIDFASRDDLTAWVDGNGNKVTGFNHVLLEPGHMKVKIGFFDKQEYKLKRRGVRG